jgi:hypothetical protein
MRNTKIRVILTQKTNPFLCHYTPPAIAALHQITPTYTLPAPTQKQSILS